MADGPQAAGDVYRLPFEGAATGDGRAEKSLFDALGAEPEFQDAPTDRADEPASEPEEESDAPSDSSLESSDEEAENPDEEPEEPEEEPEAQPTYRVTVDGQEQEVTLDELIAGYSRESDYRRKTMDLAAQRKATEAEVQTYRTAREQYASRLQALEQVLEDLAPREPDWDTLRRENPAEFAAQWAEHQRLRAAREAAAQQRQQVEYERALEMQKEYQSVLAAEREKLMQALPEWKDEAKQASEKAALANYARTTYGYTDDELGGVIDHRLILILRKAQLYDELTTRGKQELREKKAAAPVLKPGARPTQPATKGKKAKLRAMRQTLARSGRDADAAALIEQMLD